MTGWYIQWPVSEGDIMRMAQGAADTSGEAQRVFKPTPDGPYEYDGRHWFLAVVVLPGPRSRVARMRQS